MPLLITPYTFGTQLPATPAGVPGGGAYFLRRKRYMAYMMASLALALVLSSC